MKFKIIEFIFCIFFHVLLVLGTVITIVYLSLKPMHV